MMRWPLFAALALSSCIGELTEEGPCSASGECLRGFECIDNYCFKCQTGGCGGLVVKSVGPAGGMACGPDNACVVVPSGAVDQPVEISIRRSQVTTPGNLELRSLPYEVGPSDVVFRVPVTVQIPISPSNPFDNIAIYRAGSRDSMWSPLGSMPTANDVSATTSQLGFFSAARER